MNVLRWVFFLPAGFVSSVLSGYLATTVTELFGGASWYSWMLSGAVSGVVFIQIGFLARVLKPRALLRHTHHHHTLESNLRSLSDFSEVAAGERVIVVCDDL